MHHVIKAYNPFTDAIEDAVVTYDYVKTVRYKKPSHGFQEPVSIRKVIFNPPATIVIWSDGTKTIAKCKEGDAFDAETGLAMAICKRMLSRSEFKNLIKEATTNS